MLVDLVFPPVCALCHRRLSLAHRVFCESCEQAMAVCLPPLCQRCGASLVGAFDLRTNCGRCRSRSFAFERARAPLVYAGRSREAVLAFKYHDRRQIGRWLATHMARLAEQALPISEIDAVVPVPLHWLKRRIRGAYPAALLAHGVAKALQRPCLSRALRRTRWTTTQTRLTTSRRFRNVADAFRARPSTVNGRAILLVDDVLTTGATADACAAALREAGAVAVYALTAACAPAA